MNGFYIVCDAVTICQLMQGGESKPAAVAKVLAGVPEEFHARVLDYLEKIEGCYLSKV